MKDKNHWVPEVWSARKLRFWRDPGTLNTRWLGRWVDKAVKFSIQPHWRVFRLTCHRVELYQSHCWNRLTWLLSVVYIETGILTAHNACNANFPWRCSQTWLDLHMRVPSDASSTEMRLIDVPWDPSPAATICLEWFFFRIKSLKLSYREVNREVSIAETSHTIQPPDRDPIYCSDWKGLTVIKLIILYYRMHA